MDVWTTASPGDASRGHSGRAEAGVGRHALFRLDHQCHRTTPRERPKQPYRLERSAAHSKLGAIQHLDELLVERGVPVYRRPALLEDAVLVTAEVALVVGFVALWWWAESAAYSSPCYCP